MIKCHLCACVITEFLGIAGATASRHLSILVNAGLLESRKEGRWIYYRLKIEDTLFWTWLKESLKDKAALGGLTEIVAMPQEDICRKQRGINCCPVNSKEPEILMKKLKVLFLCTGNSCRSQMAEGWCRHLKGDLIEAYSAGIETHGLNPYAVKVMAEAGVDISRQCSKHVDELKSIEFDYVVTVCGHAHDNCPLFPGKAKVIHIGFDDPPKLAKDAKTEEEKLNCYRLVRDQIKKFVEGLPSTEIMKREEGDVGQ